MNSQIFTLDMLCAKNGDALLLKFGQQGSEKVILVDTGYASSMNSLLKSLNDVRCIDLLVVTHSDKDHINGASRLLKCAKKSGIEIRCIWFNGYRQVFEVKDILGYPEAETLSAVIEHMRIPLNKNPADVGKSVFPEDVVIWKDGKPIKIQFYGMTLEVLGPTPKRLTALKEEWKKYMKNEPGEIYKEKCAELDALGASAEFGKDNSTPNASSIALIAEYEGVRILLTGDAFADDLNEALAARCPRSDIHVFKLSHHGSRANINLDLIRSVNASHYLVSTDGSEHSHPHIETIRLIAQERRGRRCAFHFNYPDVSKRIEKEMKESSEFSEALTYEGGHIDLLAVRKSASMRRD